MWQWITTHVNEIFLVITACVLTITAFFTRKNYRVAQELSGIQLLYSLLNEYSSNEMADARAKLFAFFHDECGMLQVNVNYTYTKFKTSRSRRSHFLVFDAQRRKVSHFYQKLATFHEEKIIEDRLIFETWNEENLKILKLIIIEIEKSIEGYSEHTIKKLKNLYWDSRKYK